jgi:hypothetical protein
MRAVPLIMIQHYNVALLNGSLKQGTLAERGMWLSTTHPLIKLACFVK